jgi:EmrB/QacA subfamily drug resistance transporter
MQPRREDQLMSGRQRPQTWALILTSTAFFMAALDLLVVATALPAIHNALRAGAGTLEWTINAYGLATASGIITAAALGDRLGRRRLFTLGLGIFTAASFACALAPDAGLLIAARAVQGIGAAIIAPLSLTLLTAAFPPERRGAVTGIWGGLAGLAIAAGPVVGGVVTQDFSWHWIFWINVPVGLAAAWLSQRKLTESTGPATELDLPAVALVTIGALGLVWGLTEAGGHGLTRASTGVSLLIGVSAIAAFGVRERNARQPMLPLRLFRSRTFAAANLTAFLTNAALLPGAILITEYLQIGLRYSPLAAGVHFLPMTAAPVIVAPLAGRLTDRIGPRAVMTTGLALFAAGLGWVGLAAGAGATYGALVLPLLVAGAGVSMPFAATASASLAAVPPEDIGKASGTTNTLQRFGGAFGLALTTAVFTATGRLTSAAAFTPGFRAAELTAAALAVLGVPAAACASARKPARSATSQLTASTAAASAGH